MDGEIRDFEFEDWTFLSFSHTTPPATVCPIFIDFLDRPDPEFDEPKFLVG